MQAQVVCDGLLEPVDRCLGILSAAALIGVMLVVTADVVLRYVFTSPLIWAYDVVSLYMMPALFFLALPQSLRHHSHVYVDVFVHAIPPRLRHLIDALGYAATATLLAMLVWLTVQRLVTAFANGEMVDSAVSLPAWLAQVPVALGTATLALQCLLRLFAHLASVVTASPVIAYPPQPGFEGAEK